MFITDEASNFLAQLLVEEGKNCLTFAIIGHGCHGQLSIDFVNEDNPPYQINGLNVLMDEETNEALSGITIDMVGENLVFRSNCSGGCGGCGGGCGDDCSCGDDGDCGCGCH